MLNKKLKNVNFNFKIINSLKAFYIKIEKIINKNQFWKAIKNDIIIFKVKNLLQKLLYKKVIIKIKLI